MKIIKSKESISKENIKKKIEETIKLFADNTFGIKIKENEMIYGYQAVGVYLLKKDFLWVYTQKEIKLKEIKGKFQWYITNSYLTDEQKELITLFENITGEEVVWYF